jgi:outer membrane protein TolC
MIFVFRLSLLRSWLASVWPWLAAFGLICILLKSLHAEASSSSNDLSLEQAVSEALDQSPEIKFSKAQQDEASGRKNESLSGFLPSLAATGLHLTNEKYETFSTAIAPGQPVTIPLVTPITSLKFSLSLPIFDGLRNVNSFRSATAAEEASEKNRQWKEFEIEETVRDAFYRALAAQQLAEVATENIRTLEDHYAHVQARQRGGIATGYDVLRVEVQLDQARSQKIQDDDSVVLERKRLARIMGTPNDVRPIVGELPVPLEAPKLVQLSAEGALQNRKDIESLKLTEKSDDLADTAAKSWLVPTIGLMADYEFYNNTNDQLTNSDPYHNDYDVGIYARWNIFDGGSSIARSQQSAARLQQASAKLEMEIQRLPENLETWKRRYNYSVSLYGTAVSDIKKSEESVRQAKEGFRQGVRTVSEQLDAQLDLFRSRATKVTSQLTAADALIQLELTLGRKVSHDDLR